MEKLDLETLTEKEREYLAYVEQQIKTVQSVWLALQEHVTDCYWLDVREISSTQINGVSLYVVFYNGVCKKVYARSEKEAIEIIEKTEEK
jgi:hypothetical protein